MIYIGICDDNSKLAEKLYERVKAYLRQANEIADVSMYTQSRMLQYDIQEGKYFDLILSDVEMPHVDGMNLADCAKKYLPEVLIIFVTSYVKYAVDAFELSIFRYIPKNLLTTRLDQALTDAMQILKLQTDKYYFINMPMRVEKIPYSKILYIQRDGKNSVIALIDNTITKVRKSLVQVFSELNSEDFIYVDRGDIVNLAHIIKVKDTIVELKNGICLPASHTRMEHVKTKLSKFWEGQI